MALREWLVWPLAIPSVWGLGHHILPKYGSDAASVCRRHLRNFSPSIYRLGLQSRKPIESL